MEHIMPIPTWVGTESFLEGCFCGEVLRKPVHDAAHSCGARIVCIEKKGYQKIDFKISYRINSKKVSHYIFLHIENIFNRKNVLQEVYNDTKQEMVKEYQLGLFPYGGYRIEF